MYDRGGNHGTTCQDDAENGELKRDRNPIVSHWAMGCDGENNITFITGVKMESAAAFMVGTLFTALALWGGMKFTGVHGSFIILVLIAGVSSLFGLIPEVGWIASLVVLFLLICKWTTADFFPDAVLMVVAAKVLGVLGLLLLSQSVV